MKVWSFIWSALGSASLLFGVSITSPAGETNAPTLAGLSWLEGSWVQRGKKVENEEHWIAPKGGMMLGLNRTTREGGKTSFEFFRIEQTTNGLSYFASPQGRAATEFRLKELTADRVVFENLNHDFPQRIIYWREGESTLHARIEGSIKGKERKEEWHWRKSR
jgi:hypothetical protein